jgi:hypothetical protein
MDLNENRGDVNCIRASQNRVYLRAVVNKVMNRRVHNRRETS